MTKQEQTQIRKDARTSFLIVMTVVASIVLCAPRDASAQQGSIGLSITIVEPKGESKATGSHDYSDTAIGTEAGYVHDGSPIGGSHTDERRTSIDTTIGNQASSMRYSTGERFNRVGKPQTQNAVPRRTGNNEPRVLDKELLNAMLASGSQINDRDIGGFGVLDALIQYNALGKMIMRFVERTNNTALVDVYLDDVEYLLFMGAIPNEASVSLMNIMAAQQHEGIDWERLERVATRMQWIKADYEARLAAYQADPTLPYVEELRPYLSYQEVRELLRALRQPDVDQ